MERGRGGWRATWVARWGLATALGLGWGTTDDVRGAGGAPDAARPPARELREERSALDAVRATFPAVRARLDSQVAFERTAWRDGARLVHGLQAPATERNPASAPARVVFPATGSDPLVAEGEGVRVVLRPLGARSVPARVAEGALTYRHLYEDTDAVHVVRDDWTEEYLHLRSPRAPRRFDYALVEARGASSLRVDNGQVVFAGDDGRGLVILSPVVVDAAGRRSSTAARWTLEEAPGHGGRHLTLRLDPAGLEYPLLVDPTWITTGSLNTARGDGIGILLQTGKVLVLGNTASAELYDPATGVWTATGPGWPARAFAAAVLLRDGRVLAIGGFFGAAFDQCFLYDPVADSWSPAAPLSISREFHTATLLADGRVLVAGGESVSNVPLASAELYDPVSNTWTPTGALSQPKSRHTASLLRDGKVMVTGGVTLPGPSSTPITEVYDPGTGLWTRVGDLGTARSWHSATVLPDGRVLAAGGFFQSTAELFDPGSGNWSPTAPLPLDRSQHSATLLPSGRVLVAGGSSGSIYSSVLLYDPGTGLWSAGPSMTFARFRHASTLLPDGRVLVAGGFNGPAIPTAELYDNDAPAWTAAPAVPDMTTARWESTATMLRDGRVLVAGGVNLDTAEVFDPQAGPPPTWTPTANMSEQRWRHTATLLNDGRVLAAGSIASAAAGSSAEIYDPVLDAWSSVPDMAFDRNTHTATLLPCGEVLIVGGKTVGGAIHASAERYNPRSNTWRTTASMGTGRWEHTATLLLDGRVLVTGGFNGGALPSAEIYDPVAETWTPTAGPMTAGRYHHTATLLPSGKVLLVGGNFTPGSAELFDPATGTFAPTGAPTAGHDLYFSATLLPNGRVLVVGGSASPQSAEVYDPVAETWFPAPDTVRPRPRHAAALLLDGRVLLAGSVSVGSETTAEIYDVGRGEQVGWRPVLTAATDPLVTATPLSATGTGFQGLGEGSTGLGHMHSATNYPLVQLQRIDNEAVRWLPVDPAAGWSGTGFLSLPIAGVPPGPARVTVFTNGIPSVARTVAVECPPPTITSSPPSRDICVGDSTSFVVTATGDCRAYQWRKDTTPLADGGRFAGTRTATLDLTGALAADAGLYDVVVSLPCSSTTATSVAAALTVSDPLSPVTLSIAGPTSVCQTCTGGTATESHTGGGPLAYQWGYRTVTMGPITPIPGQTGPSYVLNGADFPAPGGYFLVVTVTPTCGSPTISDEKAVTVTTDPPPADAVRYFTVTSRDGENVLEWVNAAGRDTARIRYTTGTPCAFPGDPATSGMLLGDKTGPVGDRDRLSHAPLANDTTHCYTMWTDLGGGSYSAGRSNRGRPFATSGPVKWAFSTGVFSITPPTVGGTGVIAVSNDRALHAMLRGPAGGEWPAAWRPAPIGGPVQSRSPVVPITVAGASPVAFLGSQDGAVYAVDGTSGGATAFPWGPVPIAGMVQAAPAGIFTAFTGAFDYLLVGTRDDLVPNAMVALDPMTGAVLDVFDNGGLPNDIGIISGAASVDYGSSPPRVYFTSRARGSANTLWCLELDAAPGVFSLKWARALGDIDSSPVIRGDRVYVGTTAGGGTLYSIDAATGNVLLDRTFPHGDGPVKGFVFPDRASDDLYFATDNLVWGVSDTGAAAMPANFPAVSLEGGVTPSTVLFVPGSQYVYVGGSDGKLYEVDVLAGPPPTVKSATLGDGLAVVGAPSLDRGFDLVHVGTEAGIFYAVESPLP